MSSSNLNDIFLQNDIEYTDLPRAIIIHECIGISLLVGVWAACFTIRPSYKAFQFAKTRMGEKRVEKTLKIFEKRVENVKNRLMKKSKFKKK